MKKTATLLFAIGLTSCFTPKATIVAEAPVIAPPNQTPTQTTVAQVSPEKIKPAQLPVHKDGLRLPDDILALPQDDQLRSAPAAPKNGKATVIARPPED